MAKFSRFAPSAFAHFALALWLAAPLAKVHAFNTDTHAAVSEVAARHYQCQVEEFLSGQLRESMGLDSVGEVASLINTPVPFSDTYEHTYLQALMLGAEDEDSEQTKLDTLARLRMINHFYDPSRHGMGLDDPGYKEFLGLSIGVILPASDSLHWAWENFGATRTRRGDERYGWVQAREHYYNWLTGTYQFDRSHNAGETFYALGHVIHLVQDLAQPQHTRNDAHVPKYVGYVIPVGGDDAAFEDFCSAKYGNVENVKSLPISPIPVFGRLPPYKGDGIPPEFRAFWDTDQLFSARANRSPSLPDPRNGYIGDLGLAEFSNAFFVTSDTMFTGEPALQIYRDLSGNSCTVSNRVDFKPQHVFRWPKLAEIIGFSLVPALPTPLRYGLTRLGEQVPPEGQWSPQTVFRLNPAVSDYCSIAFSQVGSPFGINLNVGLTEKNLAAQAKALLPKAIAYSAGLLNYFFRGRLKMEFFTSAQGTQIRITNLTANEPLGPGTFTLLRDDGDGTERKVVSTITGYPGVLAPNDSFTANLSSMNLFGRYYLVFKGTIGNEKDIAIAAVATNTCDDLEIMSKVVSADLSLISPVYQPFPPHGCFYQDSFNGIHLEAKYTNCSGIFSCKFERSVGVREILTEVCKRPVGVYSYESSGSAPGCMYPYFSAPKIGPSFCWNDRVHPGSGNTLRIRLEGSVQVDRSIVGTFYLESYEYGYVLKAPVLLK